VFVVESLLTKGIKAAHATHRRFYQDKELNVTAELAQTAEYNDHELYVVSKVLDSRYNEHEMYLIGSTGCQCRCRRPEVLTSNAIGCAACAASARFAYFNKHNSLAFVSCKPNYVQRGKYQHQLAKYRIRHWCRAVFHRKLMAG
jgi:hypothetical protein